MNKPRLAELQRQFFDRVVHDRAADGLIATGDIDIYAGMYSSRLYDTLVEDYPKLKAALDAPVFDEIVARYLRAHPPHSFTLREAGAALEGFLRPGALGPPWAADLVALERARVEVFDGPDATPLAQADVAALGDELPALMLRWVPSSFVVPVAWNVDDIWSAIEDEQAVPAAAPAERTMLVWRRDLSVLHRTLDPDEAQLAPMIARGISFADICEVLGAIHGTDASARAVELLLRWLHAGALI
jgi:hypothetical protein